MFCCFSSVEAAKMKLPSDVVGAWTELDITKTFGDGAPPAARCPQVGGDGRIGGLRSFVAGDSAGGSWRTRQELPDDLSDGLVDRRVRRARFAPIQRHHPPGPHRLDRSHRPKLHPAEALEKIASAASAPTYGPYATYVGYGSVGGNTVTFEAMGTAVADLAVDALAGKPINDVTVPQTYVADARQLKRWGLSERKPSSGHDRIASGKRRLGGILGHDRRHPRRHGATGHSHLRIADRAPPPSVGGTAIAPSSSWVVHLNQSATAGALSASIAHELNQPLGAIRSNAEAAEVLLRSGTRSEAHPADPAAIFETMISARVRSFAGFAAC